MKYAFIFRGIISGLYKFDWTRLCELFERFFYGIDDLVFVTNSI